MSDIKDWADDADLNGEASPAGWPEGMPPSDVNNSAREMMAALRRSYVRQPWYAPGGEIVRVSGTQITIKDDTKVTDYSQFYTVGQRFRVEGAEYNTTGFISSVSYEAPTTTIEFEFDAELPLPPTINEVYVGLNYQDVQGVAGPNLLGCIIGFTDDSSKLGAGLLHANGEKFSPSLYPDLAKLYLIGTESDGSPKYRYGREKVGDVWWPKRPDVRGYFPRFLDDRGLPADGEDDTRLDPDAPRTVGSVQGDASRNITGAIPLGEGSGVEATGPFRRTAYNYGTSGISKNRDHKGVDIDLSRSVPTSTEYRPKNIAVVGVIVAYGGVVAGGLADISEFVTELDRISTATEELSTKLDNLGDIMRYMGSVDTFDDLPTEDNEVGDVYNVLDTGVNYAWTEEGTWDEFGGVIPDNVLLNNAPRPGSLSILGSGNSWENAINIGTDSAVAGNGAVVVGPSAYAGGFGSVAVGYDASAADEKSVSVGDHARTDIRATAVGSNANAGFFGTAVGTGAGASGANSVALGMEAKATKQGSIQIGHGTNDEAESMYVYLGTQKDDNGDGVVAEWVGNNYKLLGSDGKIPAERLPDDIGGDAGRVVQLGFNGVLEGGVLTFTPAEGSSTVYEIKDFYAYEIDLLFEAVGEIDDSVTMIIKNGDDTYNIVNVLHDDPTSAVTVGEMKQIMKYSTDLGWRWIFNVRATTTQAGDKVLVMPSTVANVSSGGASSLEDIAIAGEGITFTKPIVANHIASADISGSPTISAEGILSGLSSSNYLKLSPNSISGYSGSLFTGNYNWAWTVKFKTPSSFTNAHRIFTVGSSVSSSLNIWASISEGSNPAGSLALGVHAKDNWYNLYDGYTPYILETDTWYWLRLSRDISTNVYKAEVSTDGISWRTAYSFVSSYALYDSNSTMFISQVSSSYVALEYDLTGVSFTSNYGSGIDWTAYEYSAGKTEISANVDLTGYLQNTATGSFADRQILIKSSNGATKLFVDYDGVFGVGNSSIFMGSESTVTGSFYNVIGYQAQAASHSAVFGYKAKATDSYATAIGDEASAKTYGVAVGSSSGTENYGTAIGKSSQAGYYGVGVGCSAISSANYAIQIGRGTNNTANTMNVGLSNTLNVQLLDANGKIPAERSPETSFFAPATNTWTAMSLGASNTEYEAPANGYFVLYAQQTTGGNTFISMRNTSTYSQILGADHYWTSTWGAARLFVPAKKGHKVLVEYNCTLTALYFGFVPADGTV